MKVRVFDDEALVANNKSGITAEMTNRFDKLAVSGGILTEVDRRINKDTIGHLAAQSRQNFGKSSGRGDGIFASAF
ncbi:MAG: hypothetical protein VW935_03150 [Novosphingobium sp.]